MTPREVLAKRSWRGVFLASTGAFSWLAMQAVHELGHVLHAWASGGSVARVSLHPLALSRTELGANPHPLFVAWGGALLGVAIPLALFALFRRAGPARIPARFFAGFCLLANGLYLGVGSVTLAGDAGDLILSGAPPWVLLAFGLVVAPLGLAAWSGLGRELATVGEREERRLAIGTSAALAALVAGELVGSGAGGTPLLVAAWSAAVLGVLGLVLVNVDGSEVQHLVFLVQAVGFVGAGGALSLVAGRLGAPAWATLAAFLAPAALHHVRARSRRRSARSAAIDEPRLRGLTTAQLVAEVARSPHAAALTDLVVERVDARDVLLRSAREGTPEERRGAVEVAVFARPSDPGLALAIARIVLEAPVAPREDRARSLVAVWDAADAALQTRLRALALEDPGLRVSALEVRARSGDPTVLEDWLADGALDAERTAGGLALALGPSPELRGRLEALRARHGEGSPERARLEALAGALELFGG